MRVGRREVTMIAALLAFGGTTAALHAQEPEEAARRSCRCVDRAGEEIENCACVVTPDVSRIVARVAPFRRARLGVGLDWEQGAEVDRQGVRVESVAEGSPAEEAGLRAGDVLVSVAGRHLLNPLPDEDDEEALDEDRSLPVQRLLVVAAELEPGDPVQVRYLRDGVERTATVVPEEGPFGALARLAPRIRAHGDSLRIQGDSLRARLWREQGVREHEVRLHRHEAREHEARAHELAQRMRRDAVRLRAEGERLRAEGQRMRVMGFRRPFGVELVELNPDLADYFDVREGVLVAEVAEESELGLRPGDVIVSIGDREVDDVSDVRRILGSFEPGEEIRFRVVRRGDERTVTGRLDGRAHRDGS